MHVGVVIAVAELGLFAFGRQGTSAAQNSLLELTGVFAVWGLVHGLIKLRELRAYRAATATAAWRGLSPFALNPIAGKCCRTGTPYA